MPLARVRRRYSLGAPAARLPVAAPSRH